EVEVRAVAAIFAILMYRRPQHPELPRWTRHLDALVAQDDIDPALRMTAATHLVLYYNWWTGNMARANERVRRVGQVARSRAVGAVAAIFAILMSRRPQHPELPRWTRHLDALVAQDDIDPALRMTAATHLVLYYNWWTGNMARANELVRRVEPFASARAIGPF